MTGSARYLYAVTRGPATGELTDVEGIDGGRLDVVEHAGLGAVVSDVDLDEYGEEGLRENLERLEWLEKVARGHDHVIKAVAEVGPVAPLRLATICLDDAAVRARLEEWQADLHQALDRVAGAHEWSVKVIAPPAETRPRPEKPASGADYLKGKKAAAQARVQADEDLQQTGELVHTELVASVVASRRLPAQDPRLSGHTGTMVLNGAYLVEESSTERFEETVARLAREHPGVVVECGGPWPPYSFTTLGQP